MEPFAAGQVWTYATRPGEAASRVIICRVETDARLGQIVHILVNGLRLKNKHLAAGFSQEIGHMPYSGDALRESLVSLESVRAVPPFYEEGYRSWRAAFDDGKAGVWTTSLAEAIGGVESAFGQ